MPAPAVTVPRSTAPGPATSMPRRAATGTSSTTTAAAADPSRPARSPRRRDLSRLREDREAEAPCDLVHEPVRFQLQAEQGDAQDPGRTESDLVGPQSVVGGVEAEKVVATVDLDDEPLPLDI